MSESPEQTIIALVGPPCSGKTTQGDLLVNDYHALLFDTGAELREYADEETKAWINAGNLADINIIEKLVRAFFGRREGDRPVVLVGFPRSIEQAKRLEVVLEELELPPVTMVVLDVEEGTPRKRALLRQRIDDVDSVITKREEVFAQETKPTIDYATDSLWRVIHIDGEQSIAEVYKEVTSVSGWGKKRSVRAL